MPPRKPRAAAAATAKAPSRAVNGSPIETEDAWVPKGAAAKLAYIQSKMQTITKTGKHAQGYNYIQEHKVIELLREHLREQRCAIVPEPGHAVDVRPATVYKKDGFLTTLTGVIRFIDTEAPSFVQIGDEWVANPDREIAAPMVGQGADTEDKGSGKAQTYLTKYAMQKLFLIPTEQIDDADASAPVELAEVGKQTIDKAAPAALKSLRAALTDASPADPAKKTAFNNRVKAKLAADFGVETIQALTLEQVPGFQKWVLEETSKA